MRMKGYMDYLLLSEEVADALAADKPVVALESTIIAHGFTYPENLACGRKSEQMVRENGAVPATVAILGGKIHVGLTDGELEYLATAKDVTKASRRDIGVILSRGGDGAATVAGTMLVAALVGIDVFATGGIGGVHRGAESSMDISADLIELGKTPVGVVCAGAKSVLDIGLTLEYLETQGVPVLGYQTEEFPAFYTRKSGYGVDYRTETPEEIAAMLTVRKAVTGGGTIIANPIPKEYEMNGEAFTKALEQAMEEMEQKGIRGKEITPFLLQRIHALTGGESQEANLQLVLNNCALAAKIAVAMKEQ
ncbi:pseudouridine-5'-phosphate glycosidase [Eubacteriales bacterium OttesenSCG-928-M02]|nr:pseudouridine-5'-phosphate glycosidase [Eubacteriales bacterium OttesenSCG-928-M02]